MYYSQVEVSALVLNHLSESNLVSEIMMSKIMKAIDVEVNKRLELYLVNFIKYNYENGSGQHEGFVRPSDEEIEGHITSYMKMTPFSLEEKVVEKKRMGRPKKNEKEVIVAEEEMFGNLTGNVSDMKLEHPDNIAPVVDDGVKAKKEKVVKEKKEKVVKEKVEKAPKVPKEKVVKEKKEKVVKEKVEKAPKEKKEKLVKKKAVKNEEEENPYAINDDGVVNSPKQKVKKAKKEKVVKEKVEGEKKRGRPKKSEEKAKSDTEEEDTEEDSEEEVGQLAVQLQELCVVAEQPPQQQTPKQSAKKAVFKSAHDAVEDDEVAFEEYEELEDEDGEEVAVSSPKTEAQDHIVKFTDKNSGIDYFIDKQMVVENEDAVEGETWYAVKDASTRAVVGRSNFRQMELFLTLIQLTN